MPGATVRGAAGWNVVVRQINADGSGAYVMHLPVGAYTIEATATNYSVESRSVNVTLNANVQANFALKTGPRRPHAGEHSADRAGQPDAHAPVDARRTPARRACRSRSTSPGARGNRRCPPCVWRRTRPSAPNAKNTRALFAPGILASGMAPLAAGDVIKSFPPTGVAFAWGVGFTSNLWLSDVAHPFRDVEFTIDGARDGPPVPTPWVDPSGFGADMAYVPGRGAALRGQRGRRQRDLLHGSCHGDRGQLDHRRVPVDRASRSAASPIGRMMTASTSPAGTRASSTTSPACPARSRAQCSGRACRETATISGLAYNSVGRGAVGGHQQPDRHHLRAESERLHRAVDARPPAARLPGRRSRDG